MPLSPIETLRRHATQASLRAPNDLAGAISGMGFVQADPIQAPARAQDLILRQRVKGYRQGDLQHRYPKLKLEEDFLYAYGFMPPAVVDLLHPRPTKLDGFAADLLAFVRQQGVTHPRDLETAFGKTRTVNNWGGFSKATTQALQTLHYAGALRVAGRQGGVRLYAPAPTPRGTEESPERRAEKLALLILGILAPISTSGLNGTFALLRRGAPGLKGLNEAVVGLRRSGAVEALTADGETYLFPARSSDEAATAVAEPTNRVRILAPFDPIVWDRRRFDHLWGWRYRFEAYVPPSKRQLGYYAMPLLWRDQVIGWVNWERRDGANVRTVGYAAKPPSSKIFARALEKELEGMDIFLTPKSEKLV